MNNFVNSNDMPTPNGYNNQPMQYRTAPIMKTNRGMVKFIVLSVLTFGIYGLVAMCNISDDINFIASKYDGKKTMHFILLAFIFSWLTLGIGVIVWYHRVSNRIGSELIRRGINYSFNAGDFWLWEVLCSLIIIGPFVYLHKMFRAMNLICADFNQRGC